MVIEAGNAVLLERAIAADNKGFVEASVEEGRLVARVEADSVGSMLTTLDDLLVNLKVADEILGGCGTKEGQED
jgi:tRNA threonylcarbamoyladenosine modification (KEOPS) complex  Pcc1 subunit